MEKHDISGDGSYERNNDGKASSIAVLCLIQRIVYDQMEQASSIGFIVTTLTDCHLEDIECGKSEVVFAPAKNVLVKPFSC